MKEDYSVLATLGLELPPIGVRYDFFRPEGIEMLGEDVKMRQSGFRSGSSFSAA